MLLLSISPLFPSPLSLTHAPHLQLQDEIDAYIAEGAAAPVSDVEKTSLGAYTKYFKKSFIKPLFARLRTARRGESEKAAVETGDW